MIIISNFTKKYGNRVIIDNLNLTLPDKGIVSLVGASGSGKTTLLNAIGGIDLEHEGSIQINNTIIEKLSDEELCEYRLHNIGYVFQNFNLLNLDSTEDNIKISLDAANNCPKHVKDKRINDFLSLFGIKHLKKKTVNKLSGGEKQRIAIIRAIINDPSIVLCDEPTGALDEKNAQQIADILNKISSKSLVIIATHDANLAKEISDQIIEIIDGKIVKVNSQEKERKGYLRVMDCYAKSNKSSLSLSFKIKHSLAKLKNKKFRSLISNGMLSFSLAGIGVSLLITNTVSQKIEDAFSSLTNGNQIVMSLKHENQNTIGGIYSAPLDKVKDIYYRYSYFLEGLGANYMVNFEDFFKDSNDFYTLIRGKPYYLESYSTRLINEFKWLTDDKIIFPYSIKKLEEDEIVIGLTYSDMVNLCFNLQIQRSYKVLGEYIRQNGLSLVLEIANKSWQYDDEQLFSVRGVIETERPCIFHTNSLWNEEVFEYMMRLPSDDDQVLLFPWEMYKVYYFKTKEDPSIFLNNALYDEYLYDYVFERTNYSYNPSICKSDEVCNENRLFIYYVDKQGINLSHLSYLQQLYPEIKDFFYISDYGYASYASALMSGFSKNLFVSFKKDKIDEAIDADTAINSDANISLNLPEEVVMGNYLNSLSGGLRFSNHPKEIIYGRMPKNDNEIAISLGLANKLMEENMGLGKYLYISGIVEEVAINNRIYKEYSTTKVVVTGIINEENLYLYNNSNWTISFFRDKLGVSSFLLVPKAVLIELNDDVDSTKLIEKLNKTYHEYTFTSPIVELSKSMNSTFEYANTILLGFSILSTLISVLLLGTTLLLNILESKEEIKLFKFIGINKKDTRSTFVVQSIIQGLLSFGVSAFEIILVDVFLSKSLADTIGGTMKYSFNLLPISIVFLVAIFVSFSVSFVLSTFLLKDKKS